jgi:hypothetical protein
MGDRAKLGRPWRDIPEGASFYGIKPMVGRLHGMLSWHGGAAYAKPHRNWATVGLILRFEAAWPMGGTGKICLDGELCSLLAVG